MQMHAELTDINSLLQLISTCEIDTQKEVCLSSIDYLWVYALNGKK